MTKKKPIIVYAIIGLLIAIGVGVIYLKYYYMDLTKFNYDMLNKSAESGDGKYLVEIHSVGRMDGTRGKPKVLNVYGELTEISGYQMNKDGILTRKDKYSKIIYWGQGTSHLELKWLDNHTVRINGIELNVQKEVYDYRRNRP